MPEQMVDKSAWLNKQSTWNLWRKEPLKWVNMNKIKIFGIRSYRDKKSEVTIIFIWVRYDKFYWWCYIWCLYKDELIQTIGTC